MEACLAYVFNCTCVLISRAQMCSKCSATPHVGAQQIICRSCLEDGFGRVSGVFPQDAGSETAWVRAVDTPRWRIALFAWGIWLLGMRESRSTRAVIARMIRAACGMPGEQHAQSAVPTTARSVLVPLSSRTHRGPACARCPRRTARRGKQGEEGGPQPEQAG